MSSALVLLQGQAKVRVDIFSIPKKTYLLLNFDLGAFSRRSTLISRPNTIGLVSGKAWITFFLSDLVEVKQEAHAEAELVIIVFNLGCQKLLPRC